MWIPKWIIQRRRRDEERILAELYRLNIQSAGPLAEATGLSLTRLYAALDRLEADGQILSRWTDCCPPRRRVYYLPRRRDIDDGWNGGLRG